LGVSASSAATPRRRRVAREPARVPRGACLLSARNLRVERRRRTVLTHGDLDVRAGEVVALVGPNGAGKSTLLAALAGDVALADGTIDLMGAPLGSWSATELAMRRAVLPQEVVVTFPFLVRDVVRMGRAPWAHSPAREVDDAVIAQALRDSDTAYLTTRTYTTLSGGERARVSLARVWAQSTQLVLLDEPTAALDVHHQELVMGLARRRADAGDGIVVVLHDLALAARHADRVVLLSDGRVAADGPPVDVLEPGRLSRVYDHEIEVLAHPRTGALLVVPRGAG
jgi:iron complex transport system ATP-binding protein